MPIGARFYRSMYVTLGLACACLGYSELAFLPEMSVFAAFVGVLLVIAYRLEGRWSLSMPAANALGVAIAISAAGWVTYQFFRPWGGTLLDHLPWPTSLLPYLGPLLMILVPAKLFRPKHVGDFWGLQGIGLMAVALGCALAGDGFFGVLLAAYLISGIWSLTLFYYYREHLRTGAGRASARWATPPRAFRQAGCWAAAIAAPAFVLFLSTPRSGEARWELAINSGRMQTGYDEVRPGLDLNRSGSIKVNRDLVFEVKAFTDLACESPKTDLTGDQRWRGQVLNYYENGRWVFNSPPQNEVQARAQREANSIGQLVQPPLPAYQSEPPPPPLAPNEYILEFHPRPRNLRIRVLAEPVTPPPRNTRRTAAPVSILDRRQMLPWLFDGEGEWRPNVLALSAGAHVYLQRVTPRPEPLVSPPVATDENYREHLRNSQAVPHLREWTHGLVDRLVRDGRLPEETLAATEPGDPTHFQPSQYERLAQALEAYLSLSGEYKYSLNLEFQDTKLDPVEDFIFNTRRGHCQRFAAALALMLRTLGVPTRVIKGFHGLESDGDGTFLVRQDMAHSWVEALIQRQENGRAVWRWRTLDPTPLANDESTQESSWSDWWLATRTGLNAFFRNFLFEYSADQQDRAYGIFSQPDWRWWWQTAGEVFLGPSGNDWLRAVGIVLALAGCVAGTVSLWRQARRVRVVPTDPTTAFYRRLLDLLARNFGAQPQGGQTPSEFAAAVGERLRTSPATRDHAGVPSETALFYYRVRYGGRPLDDAERQALDGRLDRFEAALSVAVAPS